jgi:RNA polymerase sigma factor (sigma-70 family)
MTAPTPDRKATFRRMYDENYRPIMAYARRRVEGAEADDIVADTFLVAWRRMEEIPGGDLTLPWLYGVARRVLSDSRRSGRRRDRLVRKLGRLWGRADVVAPADEVVEDQDIVWQALDRLRPHDRELLRLAEWEQLTHAQLALVFGCSVNAVTIRLHRALRRLSAELRSLDRDMGAPDEEGRIG